MILVIIILMAIVIIFLLAFILKSNSISNSNKEDNYERNSNYRIESDNFYSSGNFEMEIEDVFAITGRGTVVTGLVKRGVIKKGDKVFVEGRIKTRKWDDNGQTRYTTEIVANSIEFLTPKIDNEQRQAMQNDQNKVQQSQQNTTVVEPPFIEDGEDDLPF